MKICHVCQFECLDSDELCPLCGADLLIEESKEENAEECDNEIVIRNPVLLATMEDVVSSDIFKDILIDNKIPFSSSQGETGSIRVLFGGGLVGEEIYVDSEDFEKADKLYEEFVNSEEIFFDEEFLNSEQEEE